MTSLKHKTISGIKWVMLTSVIQRVLSFGATIVLARILTPADYGLFALAFVMIDGFGIFKSLGFDSALVRRKDEDIAKAANTAFFLIPAMGMILFGILFVVAPWGAGALGNPQVTPIIRTLGLVFVISCFGKVPQTMLYRNMQFKYKSFAEISAQLAYVATAVGLALNGFGVWSLVIAYVLKTLVQVSIEWRFAGWRPKLEFDKSIAWDMFHFGKYILGSGIVGFIYLNFDNLVVGKLLGVTMLGYYSLSMNTSNILNSYLLGKIGGVMYPAYSKIQEDSEELKRMMLKMLKHTSIIAAPFSLGLFVFAPEILRFIYGQQWIPAAGILRILAIVGLLRSLAVCIWPVFWARGKSKADFQVSLIDLSLFVILVILLTYKLRLIGVGFACLFSALVSLGFGIGRARKIINLRLRDYITAIMPVAISAGAMIAIAVVIKLFSKSCYPLFDFALAAIGSGGIYLFLIYRLNKNVLQEIKKALV